MSDLVSDILGGLGNAPYVVLSPFDEGILMVTDSLEAEGFGKTKCVNLENMNLALGHDKRPDFIVRPSPGSVDRGVGYVAVDVDPDLVESYGFVGEVRNTKKYEAGRLFGLTDFREAHLGDKILVHFRNVRG